MPTYEFRCPDGHEFEKLYRTISGAESQAACPVCGKVAGRRMSASGFAFKGSGFYLTDYGKNAHRGESEAKAASKASSGESSSSDAPKGESKASDSAPAPAPAPADSKKTETKSEPKSQPAAPKPSAGE